jgi:hypothetical protein
MVMLQHCRNHLPWNANVAEINYFFGSQAKGAGGIGDVGEKHALTETRLYQTEQGRK